jgi:hypothetical protein
MTNGRLLPTERLWIDVEVRVGDQWHPGTLEHRRQTREGDWEGFVRWSTGPGENRIGWFDYANLRPGPHGQLDHSR